VRNPVIRKSLVSLIALSTALASAPLSAQTVQSNQARSVQILQQPMGGALEKFAQVYGVQIVSFSEDVSGKKANAVSGEYSREEALSKILDGSGLKFTKVDDETIAVGTADRISGESFKANERAKELNLPDEKISESLNDGDESSSLGVALPEVIVTGSRIRNANLTSNLDVINRTEIEKTGFTSTEDVIRSLTTNFSSRNNATIAAGSGIAGAEAPFSGTSTINLRGLGEGATLVLVNGRRIAGSSFGGQSFVDVSTIPIGAIERVEVLNDGASAIYGSDAVAGVVNFIMRKDYQGVELTANYNNSINDGDSFKVDGVFGTNWDSGRILVSASFRKEQPITTSKVTSTQDFRSIGGRDFRSLGAQPGTFTSLAGLFPSRPDAGSVVTFPSGQDGTAITAADAIPILDESELPRTDIAARALTAEIELFSTFASLEQSLTEKVTVFADAFYSRRKTDRETGAISISDALLLPGPNSPFLVPVQVDYVASFESGLEGAESLVSQTDVDRFQINGGVRAELFGDWQGQLTIGYGKEDAGRTERTILIDDFNPLDTALFAALNNSDPTMALNVFGDGSAQNLAALNSLVEDLEVVPSSSDIFNATLQFDGTVFTLPGGGVQVAFGGEFRKEEISFQDVLVDGTGTATFFDAVRSREVYALFGEMSVPLIGQDNKLSFAQSFVLSAAVRYEDYRFDVETGLEPGNADLNRVTPKFGFAWTIVDGLDVRGSWGRSFKVPNLNDLFSPSFSLPIAIFPDPLDPNGLGFASNVEFNFGGNPNLQEESGKSFSIGFTASPTNIPGLSFSVDYVNLNFTNLIGDPFTLFGVLEVLTRPDLFPASSSRDANGFLQSVNFVPANLVERNSKSLDFSIDYSFATDVGNFSVGLNATHTLELSSIVDPEQPELELAGTIAGPSDWRARANLSWSHKGWNSSVFVNYESAYDNNDILAAFDRIDSYTTVDVQLGYEWADTADSFLRGTRISLGAINLFNADFPFVDNQGNRFGVDAQRVDLRGRQVYVTLKKAF